MAMLVAGSGLGRAEGASIEEELMTDERLLVNAIKERLKNPIDPEKERLMRKERLEENLRNHLEERLKDPTDFEKKEKEKREEKIARANALWKKVKARGGFIEIYRSKKAEEPYTSTIHANLSTAQKSKDGYIAIWHIVSIEYDDDTDEKDSSFAERNLILCNERIAIMGTTTLLFEQPKAKGTPKSMYTFPRVYSGADAEKQAVFKTTCERE
jgi:hypothetical protein